MAVMASDDDNKYIKIRIQRNRMRHLTIVFFGSLLAIGFLLWGRNARETEKAKVLPIPDLAVSKGDSQGRSRKDVRHRKVLDDADETPRNIQTKRLARAAKRQGAKKDAGAYAGAQRKMEKDLSEYVSEEDLAELVKSLDDEVRTVKSRLKTKKGEFMETEPEALRKTKRLQDATRKLLNARYGTDERYRVEVILEFQDTIPDFEEGGKDGSILIELAPSELVPHSVFTFLEIARNWKGGAFHRIAGHVLQVMVSGKNGRPLAFQEYSPKFPHEKGTVGYAGRPSGPAWYVSTQNNSRNHGPGSQQEANPHEADSCFGTVIRGFDTDVQRISKVPGKGFLGDKKLQVLIKRMRILVPMDGKGPEEDGYVEWSPHALTSSEGR